MKKALLLAAAVVAATPALAEWTRITTTATDVFYLDASTIKGTGKMRRAWVLVDFKQASELGVLSSRRVEQFDCAEERYRTLQATYHAGQMANGKMVAADYSTSEWTYIAPESAIYDFMRRVCR